MKPIVPLTGGALCAVPTPKLPRPSTDRERLELKGVVRHALDQAGVRAFALATRVEPGKLSEYADPNRPDRHMPIDVALDLDKDLKAPTVVAMLAELLGYELVQAETLPSRDVDGRDTATIAKETGDVVQKLAAALADFRIDSHERREIRGEIAEAMRALRLLDRNLAGGGQ